MENFWKNVNACFRMNSLNQTLKSFVETLKHLENVELFEELSSLNSVCRVTSMKNSKPTKLRN